MNKQTRCKCKGECDCHMMIGGSGKPCPDCSDVKLGKFTKGKIKLNLKCQLCNKEIILGQDLVNQKNKVTHLECYLEKYSEEVISDYQTGVRL